MVPVYVAGYRFAVNDPDTVAALVVMLYTLELIWIDAVPAALYW
jgi:hypothetical protein